MGETLGIAHNVFEKMERERDRKERLKKVEDWQKVKQKKKARIKEMQNWVKDAEQKKGDGPNGEPMRNLSVEGSLDNVNLEASPSPRQAISDVNLATGSRPESAGAVSEGGNGNDSAKTTAATVAPKESPEAPSPVRANAASEEEEEKTPRCGKCSIQ